MPLLTRALELLGEAPEAADESREEPDPARASPPPHEPGDELPPVLPTPRRGTSPPPTAVTVDNKPNCVAPTHPFPP